MKGNMETGKPWARMRTHGPCMIFDWYASEKEARDAIDRCATKEGEQVRSIQTVAFFPESLAKGTSDSNSGGA